MPPDTVVTEASRTFLDYGLLGAVTLLLMAVLVWRERTYRADLKEEREAHQKTRDQHLADLKQYATIGESVRDQIKSMRDVVQAAIDILRQQRP